MSNVDRYINDDGKVAVLVSSGYGAGWSTWNRNYEEHLLFHPELVKLKLNEPEMDNCEGCKQKRLESTLLSVLGPEANIYCGGWGDIYVEWVDQGEEFIVDENDGYESLFIKSDTNWIVA